MAVVAARWWRLGAKDPGDRGAEGERQWQRGWRAGAARRSWGR